MEQTFLDKYEHKIIKISELKKKIKKNKKITLCHGVFDVVHPGHLRHLIYAKSKSDILVVSITSDKFIDKVIYRPHVPEKLIGIGNIHPQRSLRSKSIFSQKFWVEHLL